jgi:hypothetical protein
MSAYSTFPLVAGIFLIAAGWGAAAFAQEVSQISPADTSLRERFREACSADVETYCSAAQTRNERVACVTMHRDEFSESCQAFFAEHLPNVAADD